MFVCIGLVYFARIMCEGGGGVLGDLSVGVGVVDEEGVDICLINE